MGGVEFVVSGRMSWLLGFSLIPLQRRLEPPDAHSVPLSLSPWDRLSPVGPQTLVWRQHLNVQSSRPTDPTCLEQSAVVVSPRTLALAGKTSQQTAILQSPISASLNVMLEGPLIDPCPAVYASLDIVCQSGPHLAIWHSACSNLES